MPLPKALNRSFLRYLAALGKSARKRPRRKGGEPEREPVGPKNPKLLSGGATAELEFDD